MTPPAYTVLIGCNIPHPRKKRAEVRYEPGNPLPGDAVSRAHAADLVRIGAIKLKTPRKAQS